MNVIASVFCLVLTISPIYSSRNDLIYILYRHRRDTSLDIQGQGGHANRLTVGQTGEVLNIGHGDHIVTGGGLVSKPFGKNLPTSAGGTLGYQHQPSGTSVNAVVSKTPKFGTDVGIQASKTIWSNGQSNLEAFGGVDKHYGGAFGNQRPQGNVGIQFTHFFDRDYRCNLLRLGCN